MTTAADPSPTRWALAQYEADCKGCRKYETDEGRQVCVTCPTEKYRQATKLDETKRINGGCVVVSWTEPKLEDFDEARKPPKGGEQR